MPIYKVTIEPRDDEPHRAAGYAIADSEAESRAMVGNPPHLKVYGMREGMLWPGKPSMLAYLHDPLGHSVARMP